MGICWFIIEVNMKMYSINKRKGKVAIGWVKIMNVSYSH